MRQINLPFKSSTKHPVLRGCVANLAKVIAQSDDIDFSSGMIAFRRYQEINRAIADKYDCELSRVVAAFVSLSPNNGYLENLRSLVTLVKGHSEGISKDRLTVSTYGACKDRAWEFLSGKDFMTTTRGSKIKAFYQSIMDPEHPTATVIDGHMVGAWVGRRINMKNVAESNWRYEDAAGDVRTLARHMGILPSQCQGIIWLTWKRINQVLYKGTLDLFGDHWQLMRSVEDIRPYPVKGVKTVASI